MSEIWGAIYSTIYTKKHTPPASALEPEPPDPAIGETVTWYSDGTGYGMPGDYCQKTNPAGTVIKEILAYADGRTAPVFGNEDYFGNEEAFGEES